MRGKRGGPGSQRDQALRNSAVWPRDADQELGDVGVSLPGIAELTPRIGALGSGGRALVQCMPLEDAPRLRELERGGGGVGLGVGPYRYHHLAPSGSGSGSGCGGRER